MGRNLSEFTGLYQVAETLKFELRPIGKTEEHIKNSGLLESDFRRAEDYPKVKQILDDQHKQFLQRVLSGITFDWQPLADALTEFQKDKSTKAELEKTQKAFRRKIADSFYKDDFYALLVESTPSKLLKKLLSDNAEPSTELKTFAQFACYFKGFQENRRNIYSSEPQQTAAAFRAVNENFSRFFNASNILKTLCQYPDLVRDMFDRTHSLRGGKSLEDLFQTASYNQFIAQSGIDFFNQLVGEINYAINQYRQQHKDLGKLPLLPTLQKQILSDRETAFIVEMFQDDTELCSALSTFSNNCKHMNLFGDTVELFSSLRKILSTLTEECNLFIDAKHLDKISQKVTGSWSSLQEAMETFVSTNIKGKTNAKKYCNQEVFHLSDIKSWNVCKPDKNGVFHPVDITSYWHGEYAAELFDTEYRLYPAFEKIISQPPENLRDDDEKINIIKEYLDAVQEIYHLLKPLILLPEYDGDQSLMSLLKAHKDQLELIIPLYNKVRNYVTTGISCDDKIKLMFNKPTLADGWDNNKIKDNLAVIFRKGTAYYLGIIAPGTKIDLDAHQDDSAEESFQRMVYKLLPGPNKMLPKVFFSQKNIAFFNPNPDLLTSYQKTNI